MAVTAGNEGIVFERQSGGSVRNIVFFDVETTVPWRAGQRHELLEFGAVVLDARGLGELRSFLTLIRPKDLSSINRRTSDCNGITQHTVAHAPAFADVADDIHSLLDGHIWAGHNILKFDIVRITEAFSEIGRQAPQPSGVIDTYPLLKKTFGKRAGNYKLATLANYCGYGKQEHRSLADVRMNIDVLRSCATMLFLESNYPDVFTTHPEVVICTSTSKQSATLSTSYWQNRRSGNKHEEQGVNFQSKLSESTVESSPNPTRPSQEQSMKGKVGLSEVIDLMGKSTITVESKHAKVGALNEMRKECSSTCKVQHDTSNISSRDVVKDEKGVSSESIAVFNFLKNNHFQEDILTGYECINDKMDVTEVIDANPGELDMSSSKAPIFAVNSKKSSSEEKGCIDDAPVEDSSLPAISEAEFVDTSEKAGNEEECDLSEALISLSLKDSRDTEASASTTTKPVHFSSVAHWSDPDSRNVEGGSFLLASHVTLASIEVREESSHVGCSKVLYYKGFPLHLLECKTRIRFTINAQYAFDDKGKPRFSVLVEPSEAACEVICKCEDLIKSEGFTPAYGVGEPEWLPSLRKETGVWAARMSIGAKGVGSSATYTTKFYRSNSNGVEEIDLGHVDVSTFRNVVPHGSVVDVGFGFYVFNVNNRAGVRLLAKHITFTC